MKITIDTDVLAEKAKSFAKQAYSKFNDVCVATAKNDLFESFSGQSNNFKEKLRKGLLAASLSAMSIIVCGYAYNATKNIMDNIQLHKGDFSEIGDYDGFDAIVSKDGHEKKVFLNYPSDSAKKGMICATISEYDDGMKSEEINIFDVPKGDSLEKLANAVEIDEIYDSFSQKAKQNKNK